jgi:hypothetical protein
MQRGKMLRKLGMRDPEPIRFEAKDVEAINDFIAKTLASTKERNPQISKYCLCEHVLLTYIRKNKATFPASVPIALVSKIIFKLNENERHITKDHKSNYSIIEFISDNIKDGKKYEMSREDFNGFEIIKVIPII